MRIIIKSFSLSLMIDVALVLTALVTLNKWPEMCAGALFYAVMLWPSIWFSVIIWQVRGGGVDMIKMQNYYNLDTLRRNSDRTNGRD